ncbi:2-hydroxyglutaryl-CoA dehydratase D-component [Desulfitobacterium hafniense DCB-2]|uniref:2-hydroxyglutaryl-CoA dehydratase D-component n=1 Tax=Desulfitobacterium hafniense (strain DSM 10664 / DCB-2) TaxID=272564 RepID=B8FZT6_DESHD|nr:2-hydroxyacyl-CoA dehydratase family protein [Desulfitobacterium hafniense]ACL19160.1 2-hydroxyglutaryl-CoA dehydratase D-component [Desulfitobacterium hafniense DCB-2]
MTNAAKTGVERTYEYKERINGILGMMEQAPAEQRNPVLEGLLRLIMETNERTIDCAENGKPFVSTWYGNAPEILTAMDIHFIVPVFDILLHEYFTDLYDVKEADKISLPDDICSLIRFGAYAIENKLLPRPTAIISMLEPCDAELMLHQYYQSSEHWGGVPTFGLDPAYGSTDEDFMYFAGELKRLIHFLVEITGQKYDVDKLRKVVAETNTQYELWAEYNELRRVTPCPHGSFQGSVPLWTLTQFISSGDPRATELIRMMIMDAEAKVKAGIGAVPNEQIRILWADLAPQWGDLLAPWLAEEWGANVVMDYQGYSPYTHIDTTSEDTMLYGLARRALHEVPMIRQGRGTVEVMIEDMTRIIKDYTINCVFWPGHMGHKDVSGSVHFMQELCRSLNVPLLCLTTSLFDERYTPLDKVKQQMSEFFEATGWSKNSST